MSVRLPSAILGDMRRHAEETYPHECCGVLIETADGRLTVRRCRNVQNELHAQDPAEHPRDARTAYTIDAQELLAITREVDRGAASLSAIYHSHPDHAAYFSAEDRTRAVIEEWDEPIYPGLAYVVVSVRDGRTADVKAFEWEAESSEFVERAVEVGE